MKNSAWTHDVFLSFRGEDTRNTFTGHLHAALASAGVNVFLDDVALRRGEEISPALLRAIEGSRVAVVVLSGRYAESTWCLDEAAKIAECRRTRRQKVLPVFYDVEPTEVRKQSGSFAAAFERHEDRFLLDFDRVLRWRAALVEVANLSGYHLRTTANGHEATFIKKIVEDVTLHLNSTYLFVAPNPVGIDFRVKNMSPILAVGSDESVRMVGIWGMGGVGKTALAKAIYNHFYHDFEGRSFLSNVRENWDQPCNRVRLQKQLLFDALRSKVKIESVDSGIVAIKERLSRKRVLVVVDDVDRVDQLNGLAMSRDWFGPGSRIIITTRDEHLLKVIGVDSIYMAQELSDSESLELFSWHAFRRSYPDEGFFELSSNVVAYSGGLPLALEVLGSFLYGRTKPQWMSALDKLKKIPNQDIQKKLRISYDALTDDNVKDMFLDISCFFIGMDRNYVLKILDGCGFHCEINISILLQRCLVSIGEQNKLVMHDLLRDMGREIVREKSPKEPGRWSRLWLRDDAIGVLNNDAGTQEIEGLSLKMESLSKNSSFSAKAFREMKRLRLLQLNYVQLNGSFECLPKELRWLSWHGCPLKFIPNNFYQGNLVAISLKYSNLRQVWNSPQLLERLKILNVSHSENLTQTPDFSKLPNLERLILKGCARLREVHLSIGLLDKLVLVNLKDCKALKNLPGSFYEIKSLETLVLSGCSMFRDLGEEIGELVSLTTLLADNTGIRKIPFTIVRLKNLKHLSLCGLKASPTNNSIPSMLWNWFRPRNTSPQAVNLLPSSLKGLNSLTRLCLADCNLTEAAIPKDIGCLSSLVSLRLENNNFHTLPSSLAGLSKLNTLWLDGCAMLRSLPELPTSLQTLYARDCISLEKLPNMANNSGMQTLCLANCNKLIEVPGVDHILKSMGVLRMEGCNSISPTFKQTILQEWTRMFGTFLPGNDIPEWFTFVEEGNSLYFEVPQLLDCNLEGLVTCVVYSSSSDQYDGLVSPDMPSASMINYTKGEIKTRRPITIDVVCTHEDSLWQGHFSNAVFKLEAGDEAELIIDFGTQIMVKKVGLYLLWDRDVSDKMIEFYSLLARNEENNQDMNEKEAVRPKRVLDSDDAGPSLSSFDDKPSPKRMKQG